MDSASKRHGVQLTDFEITQSRKSFTNYVVSSEMSVQVNMDCRVSSVDFKPPFPPFLACVTIGIFSFRSCALLAIHILPALR